MFSVEDGKEFVKLARKSIEFYLHTKSLLSDGSPKEEYKKKQGVFVTLHSHPDKGLRGCIGFPEPVMPLWDAIKEGAVSAAFRDPRFPPLSATELENTVIEVSVLTVPEEIKGGKEGFLRGVEVGKDGLIMQKGARKGLLLPQVATEYGWSVEEFLQETAIKAGLGAEAWGACEGVRVWKFQAQVFSEKEPKGRVLEVREDA